MVGAIFLQSKVQNIQNINVQVLHAIMVFSIFYIIQSIN
jgi:hypothetical protein